MFSILRFVVIVGVIFYYSPVRQRGERPDPLQEFFAPKTVAQATQTTTTSPAAEGTPGHLETVWQALPGGAKQAVVDKILTSSGLTPASSKPSDTLQPGDRAPPGQKPRG
ncbi:hypothetical protein AA309_13835 [Microvirga vignae]|uniref:Uncharacterized protein n=1 Tax=Microvirga vignae TaxID=1225564 RepID=A0A0H1RCC3_9HYPH|nr:hypothetical protein [Microvirga vignae]KLK92734.1 hypothetical protein AA309_13835 [Microvirga vignae]